MHKDRLSINTPWVRHLHTQSRSKLHIAPTIEREGFPLPRTPYPGVRAHDTRDCEAVLQPEQVVVPCAPAAGTTEQTGMGGSCRVRKRFVTGPAFRCAWLHRNLSATNATKRRASLACVREPSYTSAVLCERSVASQQTSARHQPAARSCGAASGQPAGCIT